MSKFLAKLFCNQLCSCNWSGILIVHNVIYSLYPGIMNNINDFVNGIMKDNVVQNIVNDNNIKRNRTALP